jgi:hypothetical protein
VANGTTITRKTKPKNKPMTEWKDLKAQPQPRKEPPTNKEKWLAQARGMDADYIPGLDDGEWQEPRRGN